jgi:tetratricopeptide (TPR) repeat protein
MHSATRLDDLKILECFLQNSLHAHIGRIIPFRVQCLYKDETLWVLAQHPTEVAIDIPDTFNVLERALQAEEPKTPLAVKMYLRAEGNQRPYSQQSFTVYPLVKKVVPGEADPEMTGTGEDRAALEPHDSLRSLASIDSSVSTLDDLSAVPATIPEVVSHPEHSDGDLKSGRLMKKIDTDGFVADIEHSFGTMDERKQHSMYPPASDRHKRNRLFAILGGVGAIALVGGAGYMGSRPCVLQTCTELSSATQLTKSSLTVLSNPQVTVPEVLSAQKQLRQSVDNLESIPAWSGSHDSAQKLLQATAPQVTDLDTTVGAMNQAYKAATLVQTPPIPVAKWQESKQLWTDSIATLQKIPAQSKIYPLAQQKLTDYQGKLADVDRRLQSEIDAQEKLKSAVQTIDRATTAQTTAKSLAEWRAVKTQWDKASSELGSIPDTTSIYPQAQAQLKSAQPKMTIASDKVGEEERAAKNYQNAVNLAQAAQLSQKSNKLDQAVIQWNQAVVAIQSVPQTSTAYDRAKPLVGEYTKNFQQVQSQLKAMRQIAQANQDLQRTCTGNPQICSYTVTNKGIVVRLMPIYAQTLMQTAIAASTQGDTNAKAGVLNHVNTLGNALQTIADNAKLPLQVFGADGKQIQNYRPS